MRVWKCNCFIIHDHHHQHVFIDAGLHLPIFTRWQHTMIIKLLTNTAWNFLCGNQHEQTPQLVTSSQLTTWASDRTRRNSLLLLKRCWPSINAKNFVVYIDCISVHQLISDWCCFTSVSWVQLSWAESRHLQANTDFKYSPPTGLHPFTVFRLMMRRMCGVRLQDRVAIRELHDPQSWCWQHCWCGDDW